MLHPKGWYLEQYQQLFTRKEFQLKKKTRSYEPGIPFSDVSCFSGKRSMAAGKIAGSDLPFALNAYIDAT